MATTDPAATGADTARPVPADRRRAVVAAIAGVVAVATVAVGVVGLWTLRTATDSDRFEEGIRDVVRRDDVSEALAGRIVDEIATTLDLAARVDEALPDALDPAADLLLAGVRADVEDRLAESIRSDAVSDLVGGLAGRAHAELVDLLDGDGLADGLSVDEGEVRINLLPLVSRALLALQQVGLFDDVDVPDLDRAGDPDEQRAELEEALGRDLPDDFAEPVVYRSETIAEAGTTVELAQRVLVIARRGAVFLLIGGLALAYAAIRLSRERLRAAAYLLAGFFAVALLQRIALRRAIDQAADAVEDRGSEVTIAEILGNIEASLHRTLVGLGLALLIVFGAVVWVSWQRPRAA